MSRPAAFILAYALACLALYAVAATRHGRGINWTEQGDVSPLVEPLPSEEVGL